MVVHRPPEDHLLMNLIIGNAGHSHSGFNWVGINDDFVTADANDLMRFAVAPNGLAFRIFSVHFYFMTVHVTNKTPDQKKAGELNLDLNLDRHEKPVDVSGFSRANHIAHTRLYLWKCDHVSLIHDADDDDVYDAATDFWNPNANREIRTYDPSPHWIYPSGIDVGPYLGLILAHGGRKNLQDYSGGETFVHCMIEYSLVPRKDFKKVFGR